MFCEELNTVFFEKNASSKDLENLPSDIHCNQSEKRQRHTRRQSRRPPYFHTLPHFSANESNLIAEYRFSFPLKQTARIVFPIHLRYREYPGTILPGSSFASTSSHQRTFASDNISETKARDWTRRAHQVLSHWCSFARCSYGQSRPH